MHCAVKRVVEGKPDKSKVSTSYVERNTDIIRQHCKRYAPHASLFEEGREPRLRLRPPHDVPQLREDQRRAPHDARLGRWRGLAPLGDE